MNRSILTLVLATAVCAAAPAPKPEDDVRAAMEAWKQAVLAKDVAKLDKLLHEDLTYSHSNGRLESKAEVLAALPKPGGNEAIDFSESTVRVYGSTALVRGNVSIKNKAADGAVTTLPLNILHVWMKGASGWQLVARQSTRLPQS